MFKIKKSLKKIFYFWYDSIILLAVKVIINELKRFFSKL